MSLPFWCQVRHALKLRGYKKGRISQLVSLTRPTSSASSAGAATPNPARGQSMGEVGGENEVVGENKEQVLQVLQEVAEEERLNEEVRGRPEILQDREDAEEKLFQDAGLQELPRLYGKQTPRGAWSHVVAPDWVKEILALFPEPGPEGEPEEDRANKKQRKMKPNETCRPKPSRTLPVHPARKCIGTACAFGQRGSNLQVL